MKLSSGEVEPEVQRHEDGAEAGGAEHGFEERRVVEAEESYSVAMANPALTERCGGPVDALQHRCVGPGFALKAQASAIRREPDALLEPSAERDVD